MPDTLDSPNILIVEDEAHIIDSLEDDILQALPEARIDRATSVEEAREKLRLANPAYNAVILDCRLPARKIGSAEEADFTIAPEAIAASPDTIIIHITAHSDDPVIRRSLDVDDPSPERRRFFIQKDGDWMKAVTNRLVRSLHIQRIRCRFDHLFGSSSAPFNSRLHGAVGTRGIDRARSLAIAILCEDAAAHWEDLPESLRNDLKSKLGYRYDQKTRTHHLDVFGGDFGTQGMTTVEEEPS